MTDENKRKEKKDKQQLKTIQYWEDRAKERENSYQAKAAEELKRLEKVYDLAFDNIEREINSAVRQLDKKYYMNGQAADDDAYYARLNRLEGLKREIEFAFRELAGTEHDYTTNFYTDIIKEGYYRTLFDIQKGVGYGFNLNALPTKVINETLAAKWSGKNYSARIWKNVSEMASKTRDIVQAGFLSGMPVNVMVGQIKDGAIKNGKFNAQRLIRTETNYFSNQGELFSYAEAGIEEYQFLATLDLRTSDVCRDLDGEKFAVKDALAGKNYPPMHAFCRSTTVAWFGEEAIEGMERRAREPSTGRLYKVSADTSYKDWYNQYVSGNEEAKKAERMLRRAAQDKRQYERYVKVLGKEFAPKTFEDFREMKYNDIEGWKFLQAEYRLENKKQREKNIVISLPEGARIADKKYLQYLNELYERDAKLKGYHERLLKLAPNRNDYVILKDKEVAIKDLAALTAKTGHEFALFSREKKKILVHGGITWSITGELYDMIINEYWLWEAHSHPNMGSTVKASLADIITLKDVFTWQNNSVIINVDGYIEQFTNDINSWFN